MRSAYSLSKEELEEFIRSIDPARYRVDQIWDGIYKHYYQSWDEFSNIPSKLIEQLSQTFQISPLDPVECVRSEDGNTEKYLFKLPDGELIETVSIKSEGRNTVCISTQVGCPVGCVFCATGTMGFKRNLLMEEIVSQVTYFAHLLAPSGEKISNIVLMGMGEPFLNYDQTVAAVSIFNKADTFDIGARRITISTIGIPERIKQFAEIGKQFNLAISLHAANDNLRNQLVPLAKRMPLASLLDAARYYIEKTNRRITYEYVLIHQINDSLDQAKELSLLLKGQNCHVNLIALNKNDHFAGKAPGESAIRNFSEILLANGIPTTIRNSQGANIQAGCGQLSGRKNTIVARKNAGPN